MHWIHTCQIRSDCRVKCATPLANVSDMLQHVAHMASVPVRYGLHWRRTKLTLITYHLHTQLCMPRTIWPTI